MNCKLFLTFASVAAFGFGPVAAQVGNDLPIPPRQTDKP